MTTHLSADLASLPQDKKDFPKGVQMKTILSRSPHESSFSFSRRYFHFNKKTPEDEEEEEEILNKTPFGMALQRSEAARKVHHGAPFSKLRSAMTFLGKPRSGQRVLGTLFGRRRGNVRFAVQEDPKVRPVFLVEIPVPTSALVREMASGLVRIALECEKQQGRSEERKGKKKRGRVTEERSWSVYCNGKKCGVAVARKECEAEEWDVLDAVGPTTMGAGVLPRRGGNEAGESELGELMYMRARFERVVGSRDSEAFYMMSPDDGACAGPELSVYLLRA